MIEVRLNEIEYILKFSSISENHFGKNSPKFRRFLEEIEFSVSISSRSLHFCEISTKSHSNFAKSEEIREILKNARLFAKNGAKDWKNSKSQKWRGDKHVELEKCCKMSLWLQKSALIQPRTSRFSVGNS